MDDGEILPEAASATEEAPTEEPPVTGTPLEQEYMVFRGEDFVGVPVDELTEEERVKIVKRETGLASDVGVERSAGSGLTQKKPSTQYLYWK